MTDPELRKLYSMACDSKGFEPNDGQFKTWKLTLGWCEKPDLEKSLVGWFSNESSFPMPAELKPLAEKAKRERLAKGSEATVLVAWRCEECNATRSGWISPADLEPRYCDGIPERKHETGELCGGAMHEIHRG